MFFFFLRLMYPTASSRGRAGTCLIKSSFVDGKQSIKLRIQATSVVIGWQMFPCDFVCYHHT